MTRIDPCKDCPLLNGIYQDSKTPCQNPDGLFLGLIMVSPLACRYSFEERFKRAGKLPKSWRKE